jgi:hypothetical protein
VKIGKAPDPKYERIHQLIHSAPDESTRKKWELVLKALEARDKLK